tara:strand:+ start:114917 stop:115795 length:879 start_codon:yes stop_codon:yes gene_type:complete
MKFRDRWHLLAQFTVGMAACFLGLSCESSFEEPTKRTDEDHFSARGGQAESTLFAYEAFDEVTGQPSDKGLSFGWSGCWQFACDSGAEELQFVDAPSDFQFGEPVRKRCVLELANGASVRSQFDEPIILGDTDKVCISFLAQGAPVEKGKRGQLRVTLEPSDPARLIKDKCFSFGFYGQGDPYIVDEGLSMGRLQLSNDEVRLCVVTILRRDQCVWALMKIFTKREPIVEPPLNGRTILARDWTVLTTGNCFAQADVASIRLSTGVDALWHIDDLRIGRDWNSVTEAFNVEK